MSDWISVQDRLPNSRERVIAFDNGGFGVSSAVYSSNLDGWYLEGDLDKHANVTHWMPLPEPPNSIIFHKEYDGESIADVYRDVYEAVDQRYNSKLDDIPVDEHGFQKGKFVVSIVWSE